MPPVEGGVSEPAASGESKERKSRSGAVLRFISVYLYSSNVGTCSRSVCACFRLDRTFPGSEINRCAQFFVRPPPSATGPPPLRASQDIQGQGDDLSALAHWLKSPVHICKTGRRGLGDADARRMAL